MTYAFPASLKIMDLPGGMMALKFCLSLGGWGVVAIGTMGVELPCVGAGQMTGMQVLARCQKAYDAVRSYSGTTKVSGVSLIGQNRSKYQSSANILFVRPGKLRVDGTALFGNGRYAFVSDGRTTWQTFDVRSNQWQPAQNTEMVIATFTGVSHQAATTIPAILLHTQWGNPFARGLKVHPQVSKENVGGHATYKVTVATPLGDRNYWIDQASFLLVQSHQTIDLSGMRSRAPKGGQSFLGKTDQTESYVVVHINAKLSPTLFSRPGGSPH